MLNYNGDFNDDRRNVFQQAADRYVQRAQHGRQIPGTYVRTGCVPFFLVLRRKTASSNEGLLPQSAETSHKVRAEEVCEPIPASSGAL